jgi:hypothetical protein
MRNGGEAYLLIRPSSSRTFLLQAPAKKNRKRKRASQKKSEDPLVRVPSEVSRRIERVITKHIISLGGTDVGLVQKVFGEKLDLPHVDLDEIAWALNQTNVKEALLYLAAVSYNQTVKAAQVFATLDRTGKGCIVQQDLQEACDEILSGEQAVSSEEVSEMMEFCSSSELLSKDDIIRIARQVNL